MLTIRVVMEAQAAEILQVQVKMVLVPVVEDMQVELMEHIPIIVIAVNVVIIPIPVIPLLAEAVMERQPPRGSLVELLRNTRQRPYVGMKYVSMPMEKRIPDPDVPG